MNKASRRQKLFWVSAIVGNMVLWGYSFLEKNGCLSLLALVLVLFIKRYGYDLLFKKYDEKWDQKHQEFIEKKRRYQKNV